jgi:Trypsin-like peptidase domain
MEDVRVGRLMTDDERAARMEDEKAAVIDGEILRTAFAIDARHVLTAWHCTVDHQDRELQLWFRMRTAVQREYVYIPVRVSHYDIRLDVACLTIDLLRLEGEPLDIESAERFLSDAALILSRQVDIRDQVQLLGFPSTNTGADSDTIDARVVDNAMDLGDSIGIKLFSDFLAASIPASPSGMSGSPVMCLEPHEGSSRVRVVGVIRGYPGGPKPDVTVGGSMVATRMSDVIGLLPEATLAHAAAVQPELVSPTPDAGGSSSEAATQEASSQPELAIAINVPIHENILKLTRACSSAMFDNIVRAPDSGQGDLVGWAHFFDESREKLRPTAVSTAYGLKLLLAIDAPDGRLNRPALAETLWSLRLPEGGWCARTGKDVARPETWALVLGALSDAGNEPSRLGEEVEAFESSLSSRSGDPESKKHTYVTCAIIRGLARLSPRSDHLPEFRDVLLDGALSDRGDQDLTCWGQEIHPPGLSLRQNSSVVHTAMSVVALARVRSILGPDQRSDTAISQAVRWLCHHPSLDKTGEDIRRPIRKTGKMELLGVRHFTAAWVARALIETPGYWVAEVGSLFPQAMREVSRSQSSGIWEWEVGGRATSNQPVWMTYQGIRVLKEYAMLVCPPVF